MVYVVYALLVVLVIYLSIKISYYIDQLDKKSSVSSAFIGGVLLAAVTSLPELFTSLSSVLLVGKPELVIGNILGSNLFNLAVLGFVFILYSKKMQKATITTSHNTTLACLFLIYLVLSAALVSPKDFTILGVSVISMAIFILYGYSVRKMSADEDTGGEDDESCNLTVPQILGRFALLSVCLIIASVAITYASDYIGMELGLGSTLAGAILLGIATSLPEVISCFALAKFGNFNAMVGNIAGSNLFNLSIFLLADLLYVGTTLYMFTDSSVKLVVFGLIATALIGALVVLLTKDKKQHNKPLYITLSALPIVCYVLFLVV